MRIVQLSVLFTLSQVLFLVQLCAIFGQIVAGIYLFNGSNGNLRTMCEHCSNLAIKTPELRVFVVNFKQISHIVLVLPF